MHWTLFAFAGLGLAGAHLLRVPTSGGRFGGLVAFLSGLLVIAILIRAIAGVSDIGRTTDFDGIVNSAAMIAAQDDAPLIVFSGASFSRNAIDDERLTLALREKGYNYRVVSLSLEAASMLERDAHLEQFIAQSGRVPAFVFVEVAEPFDKRPTFFFNNSKFSVRGIEQYGPKATVWTSFGLIGGQCAGAPDCLKQWGLLGAHAALNGLNVGLLSDAAPSDAADLVTAYDPQTVPRMDPGEARISAETAEITDRGDIIGPQWARSFRAVQRQRLSAQGVRAVGYYYPPVLDPGFRAYVTGLCRGELAEYPCFSPDTPAFMTRLDGPHWFDPEHLLDSGAAIYSRWLTDELIASGVLDGGVAQ